MTAPRAPTKPTRLGKLLSLDETRAFAVAEIVAAFRATGAPDACVQVARLICRHPERIAAMDRVGATWTGSYSLAVTAVVLGVGERTLKRWVAEFPALAEAIEAVRQERPGAAASPKETV